MKKRYTAAIKSHCFEKEKVRNREQGNLLFYINTLSQRWFPSIIRRWKHMYSAENWIHKNIKRYKGWKIKKDKTQGLIKIKYVQKINTTILARGEKKTKSYENQTQEKRYYKKSEKFNTWKKNKNIKKIPKINITGLAGGK